MVERNSYNHARLEPMRRILRFLLKTVAFTTLAKVGSVEGVENVPTSGPAILMINHIAFIDPIVVMHILPRNIVPMAKIEVYGYPVIGIFPRLWQVIPVRREENDRRAVQKALEVLRAGEIILVAPEGTRNPFLQQGKEGVAYLALRGNAPVVPVAIDGTEDYPALRFTAAWRKSGAKIRFGRPMHYLPELKLADRGMLRKMTDEALYALAGMLPPERRGFYSDLSQATQDTFIWG